MLFWAILAIMSILAVWRLGRFSHFGHVSHFGRFGHFGHYGYFLSYLSISINFYQFSSVSNHFDLFDQVNPFLIRPILEVWVLLLENIITAKPMVPFGFLKHQKVY